MSRPGKRLKIAGEEPYEEADRAIVSSNRVAAGTRQPWAGRARAGLDLCKPANPSRMRTLEEFIKQIGHASGPPQQKSKASNATCGGKPSNTPSSKSEQLPEVPKGLEIQFGDQAKAPRWLVEPASPQSQQRQHNDITLLPPTESFSAMNSPSTPRMATLAWKFDAGPSSQWKGLTEDELSEHAYKSLENAIRDPIFRDQLRLAISTGSYADIVADVEDCLPPLPVPPSSTQRKLEIKTKPDIDSPKRNAPKWPPFAINLERADQEDASPNIQNPGNDGAQASPPPLHGLPTGNLEIKESIERNLDLQLNMQALGNDGTALPGGLPAANPYRQHAITKIIPRNPAPRPNLIDSRQTAKKSASGKEATEEKVPRSVKIEQLNASLLDRPDFRDKVVPMRTFRRIRPWAGDRVRKADINRYDLYQLPIFPSAERAFVPWIDTRAPLVSSSPNGATAAPNWVAPNGSTTTPVPGGVRRNPRRRARNN